MPQIAHGYVIISRRTYCKHLRTLRSLHCVTRYRTQFAKYATYQFSKWRPTVNVGGTVIVKCANPAFTKVQKKVNDDNYNKYPKYVCAYHP